MKTIIELNASDIENIVDEKYASVILRRYAESAEDTSEISVLRNGEIIPYAALVKEVGAGG